MSTIDQAGSSTFSSHAMDLLDCFSSGFDEVLSQIAIEIASHRSSEAGEIEVCESDIREAAEQIANAVQQSRLSPLAKRQFQSMMDQMARRPKR